MSAVQTTLIASRHCRANSLVPSNSKSFSICPMIAATPSCQV
jgi:hypothetical protein